MGRGLLLAALWLVALAPSVEARPWAWLGVRIRDISEQEVEEISGRHGLREGYGVMIVEVMTDTPASRAGLRAGDLLVAVDGGPVTEARVLQRMIAQAPLDRTSRVTVLRVEGRRELPVRLVTMPAEVAGERVAAEFGFLLAGPGSRREAPEAGPGEGSPTVAAVASGGPAALGGLEVGDVLVQVDGRAVLTRDDARQALGEVVVDRGLRLTVRRAERLVTLSLSAP